MSEEIKEFTTYDEEALFKRFLRLTERGQSFVCCGIWGRMIANPEHRNVFLSRIAPIIREWEK